MSLGFGQSAYHPQSRWIISDLGGPNGSGEDRKGQKTGHRGPPALALVHLIRCDRTWPPGLPRRVRSGGFVLEQRIDYQKII